MVALPEYKAWAELVAVPSKYVYKLPKDLKHLDAVTITMNYTVAYILLFEIGGLSQGKSVLVHSVGGGVVSIFHFFNIQISRLTINNYVNISIIHIGSKLISNNS